MYNEIAVVGVNKSARSGGSCWKKFGRGLEVSNYTTDTTDSKGRAGQFERRGGGEGYNVG